MACSKYRAHVLCDTGALIVAFAGVRRQCHHHREHTHAARRLGPHGQAPLGAAARGASVRNPHWLAAFPFPTFETHARQYYTSAFLFQKGTVDAGLAHAVWWY